MRDSVVLRSSVCDAVVSQPLASFTHLTKLHLIMPAAADMQLHVLTRSFAVMPQLQAVRIDGFQHGGASRIRSDHPHVLAPGGVACDGRGRASVCQARLGNGESGESHPEIW